MPVTIWVTSGAIALKSGHPLPRGSARGCAISVAKKILQLVAQLLFDQLAGLLLHFLS